MNIRETGELLLFIQVLDNRPVDEAVVLRWHPLVEDLDLAEAKEAVNLFDRETPGWIKPANIRANVERMQLVGVEREDEWGNVVEPDAGAGWAVGRLGRPVRAVTS